MIEAMAMRVVFWCALECELLSSEHSNITAGRPDFGKIERYLGCCS